jgi:hypothetical protein
LNGQLRVATPLKQEMPGLMSTRPFLESLVRDRMLAVENIRLVTGRANGLVFDGDRVTGARCGST